VGKLGENLQIRRFSRFRLGEGIEKRAEDFAEEVRQQVAG
jgi:elongation factor Ts